MSPEPAPLKSSGRGRPGPDRGDRQTPMAGRQGLRLWDRLGWRASVGLRQASGFGRGAEPSPAVRQEAELVHGTGARHWLGYGAVALGTAALSLALLQVLLGQRLQQAQLNQLGSEVAFNLRLGELALERFSPRDLSELSGMRLAVGGSPDGVPPPRPSTAGQIGRAHG